MLTETTKENCLRADKLYNCSFLVTFSSTSLVDRVLITNPSGSGVVVTIFDLNVSLNLASKTSQLNQIRAKVFKGPTITANGSARTVRNLNIGNSEVTETKVYEEPTISASGTLMFQETAINGTIKVSPLRLPPNTTLLIELGVNDADNDGIVNLTMCEEAE